jgi:NhaP-type Na+/H+ or K+/H+ antiporter
MMAPKGLAAAVLASLPMQFGVPGAEQIRDVAFMTVLVSIVLTALLVMLYTRPGVRDFYGRVLGAPGGQDEPITPGR